MKVILLVPRDPPGEENGVGPGVALEELVHVLLLLPGEGVGWRSLEVPMQPYLQPSTQEVLLEGLETRLP